MTIFVSNRSRAQSRSVVRVAAVALLLAAAVTACTTEDDESDRTPTTQSLVTSTATASGLALTTPTGPAQSPGATPTPAATVVPATLSAANGQTISDGVCQATIPDSWSDEGLGRGTTSGGARWILFGNRLTSQSSDADWTRGVELVKNQANAKPGSTVEEGDDFIRVTLANDRGFSFRGRFGNRYCDFSVTSSSRPIPPDERAFWDAITGSLKPVASGQP